MRAIFENLIFCLDMSRKEVLFEMVFVLEVLCVVVHFVRLHCCAMIMIIISLPCIGNHSKYHSQKILFA